jgi:4-hydroxybenzoate polyprenyltransferase
LLAFAYLGILLLAIPPAQAFIKLGILVIWIAGAASFGHFINDWSDGLHDERGGKENLVSGLGPVARYTVFVVLLVIMVIPICWYSRSVTISMLILVHVLLFLLYSHPAIRLKEAPIGGILIDSLYAHLIPAIIVMEFFNFGS